MSLGDRVAAAETLAVSAIQGTLRVAQSEDEDGLMVLSREERRGEATDAAITFILLLLLVHLYDSQNDRTGQTAIPMQRSVVDGIDGILLLQQQQQ
jgi:hypothetical protein